MEIYAFITDPYGRTYIYELCSDESGKFWKKSEQDKTTLRGKFIIKICTKTPFQGKSKNGIYTIISDQPFNQEEFDLAINDLDSGVVL